MKIHPNTIEADVRYLAPVRALLPSYWEYYFLAGPLECGPALGIGEIFPGQTYNCWFHAPSLVEFQSVHTFLEDVIEDEGPFDVAWGFSAVCLILDAALDFIAIPGPSYQLDSVCFNHQ